MATLALTRPATTYRLTPALVSLVATGAFAVLLIALHFLKPQIDPSWRFISEYAIGDFGWLMAVAFLTFAFGHVALVIALWPHTRTIAGRIGLACFLLGAAGLAIAGIFPTDPITTAPESATTTGQLHSLGGAFGIGGFVGVLLISWSVARNHARLKARRTLLSATGLVILGFVVSIGSLVVLLSQSGGTFGPDVPIGWPNRFEVLTSCIWLAVAARCAARLSDAPNRSAQAWPRQRCLPAHPLARVQAEPPEPRPPVPAPTP